MQKCIYECGRPFCDDFVRSASFSVMLSSPGNEISAIPEVSEERGNRMSNRILTVENITQRYGQTLALDDVSICLRQGQIYGLVGNNGAGKTTLMRLITGQTPIQKGEIGLFGCRTAREIRAMRRRTGALIEAPGFFDDMTAEQNLEYFRLQFGIKEKKVVRDTLEKAGLSDTRGKRYKNFSLGMKQRLGIGLALLNTPEFLILDEPINGLDPAGIVEIRNMLLEIHRSGATILITSHILSELSNVATHYGFLSRGRLLEQVSAGELSDKCSTYLDIAVDDVRKMAELMKEKLHLSRFEVAGDGHIYLYERMEEASAINREAVLEGLKLRSIENHSIGLEDYYMNLIGGACHA